MNNNDRTTYEFVKARTDAMVATRYNYESVWQSIADNLFGRRDFTTSRTPGTNRKARIYDDTASQMLDMLSGAMQSLLVNPAERWFALRFEDAELNDSREASDWLRAVEFRLDHAIKAATANFNSQCAETFIDLIGFGTGGLFIDDVPGIGVQFSNRPLQEIYIIEDAAGIVVGVARKFKLTADQAVDKFGDKAKSANRAVKTKGFEDKHEYRQLITKNNDQKPGRLDASGMPWSSVIISMEDQAVMSEGGFREMPLITPRWTKEPGEVYGRGSGHNALSNGGGLNEQKKTAYMAGQLAVAPPRIMESEAVLGSDVSFAPHALIIVDTSSSQMNPPIQELRSSARFDVSEKLLAMDQDSVRAAFHWPLLQSLQDPRMTATQVLELSAQTQRHLAPILGRIQTEFLDPIIDRVFAIEARGGRLPPMPAELNGVPTDYTVDYKSAAFNAQKTNSARLVIDFSSAVANLSSVDPGVLDVVNFDEGVRELGLALDVPPSMMNSPQQVEAIRQANRELAAEQAEAEQMAQSVDNISKLQTSQPNNATA